MKKAHDISARNPDGIALCGIKVYAIGPEYCVDRTTRKPIVTCKTCLSIAAGRDKLNDGMLDNHRLPSRRKMAG